ncbi:MAG: alpha/beta hydrolase [Proteobacteria bacterium]|nr:MAG: alpha/beta hydrolase [Pseudomonadota bacterium]
MTILHTSDGHPLYFQEYGSGSALVFVHGFAAHGGFFEAAALQLASDFRVIVPDLRGHRFSRQEGDRPTLPQLARDLNELLDHLLPDEKSCLAGWSMGALVCLESLRQEGQQRTSGLIVEDMSPRILNDDTWHFGLKGGFDAAMSERSMALMRRDWRRFSHAAAENLFARWETTSPTLRRWALQQLQTNDADTLVHLWRSLSEHHYERMLATLHLPTLIVWGKRSRLYSPAVAEFWLQQLPQGRDGGCDESGHAPHLEQPEHFSSLLREFLFTLTW